MSKSKWPSEILYFRHLPSGYNNNRLRFQEDPEWLEFVELYEKDFHGNRTRELADQLQSRYEFAFGDAQTPVAEETLYNAELVAKKLRDEGERLPDIVAISPYLRTNITWERMVMGWPELAHVNTIREERIREQEHGLATLYINWRVFHVKHPEQRLLYEREGPYYYRYPQGNNVPDVRERHGLWLGTMIRDYSDKVVWNIGHHLGVLSFMAQIERWDDLTFIDYDVHKKPINMGVTKYKCDPDEGEKGKLLRVYYNRKLF